jgi:hypothetical protein
MDLGDNPMLQAQEPQSRTYGADDLIACPTCKGTMSLIRRQPHPDHGDAYELQTFRCRDCDAVVTRSADPDGNPPP